MFIELLIFGSKASINVNQIVSFSPKRDEPSRTVITYNYSGQNNHTYDTVDNSYEDVKAKIERALRVK